MNSFNRRHFLLTAAAGAAIPAITEQAWAQPLPSNEQALYEAAKREGELVWLAGHVSAEPAEAAGKAFTARYPGIKVTVQRASSQVLFQRISQDLRAGAPQSDVFSSTDHTHYQLLKRQGQLERFRPKNVDSLIKTPGFTDPDDFFQITSVLLFLIGYNTQKVQADQIPKSWLDAVDPKWKNQLAIGHPGYSGGIAALTVALQKMYGWDYFKKLEQNKPHLGRSADDPITLLNAGERNIGLGLATNTLLLSISRGNPLKLIYPTDGVLTAYSPSAIPKNAPHPNAAKLFMEFLTGTAYAQAVRPFFVHSLRPEVPPPEGALALSAMKLISPTPKEVEAGIPEIKEKWRDTFGI
ncbi:MAG: transporter substrate-binding protein [Polaromonas sp.]|nr:transporter substrate-binding protein [Polaromonas sp.]